MIGVIDILLNDANVLAMVGTKVYPMERDQNEGLPAITVDVTDIEPNPTKDGVSTLDEEFVSVISYDSTYKACRLLAADCRTALDRYAGTNKGVVIQQIDYLNELSDKELINNKRVFFIEQHYKVRVVR